MCWSPEVSAATAAFEIFAFVVVLYRSLTSTKKIDKEKFYLLFGGAITILCVEIVEVLLWMKKNEILPIMEGIHQTCSARNANLTRLLPLIIYAQPMTSYWMFTKICNEKIQDRLVGPRRLAIVFYILVFVQLFIGEKYGWWVRPVELIDVSQIGMEGPQTCTFYGLHGHLHWMIKFANPWWLPNVSVYLTLQALPVFIGLPMKHLMPHIVITGMIILCTIYSNGTFEAGSIWCWTGISAFLLMLLEPWLPLPKEDDEAEEEVPVAQKNATNKKLK